MGRKEQTDPIENAISEAKEWYNKKKEQLEELCDIIEKRLKQMLKEQGSGKYPIIEGRIKDWEQLELKVSAELEKDNTFDFKGITDTVALRITVKHLLDIPAITKTIKDNFIVLKKDDKSKSLGPDRFGYTGVHFDCHLRNSQQHKHEWSRWKNQVFEIQLRSLYQNAWAELNHKYYKAGSLPEKVQRRLNALAATTELLDREFDRLERDIKGRTKKIKSKAAHSGKVIGEPIDSQSIKVVLENCFPDHFPRMDFRMKDEAFQIIKELDAFGINNADDLLNMIPIESDTLKEVKFTTIGGFLRYAMIISDAKKYFDKAYDPSIWNARNQLKHKLEQLKSDGVDISLILPPQ